MVGNDRIADRDGVDISDIVVERGLAPRPAKPAFEYRDRLAEEELIVLHRIVRGRVAQRGAATRDGVRCAFQVRDFDAVAHGRCARVLHVP